MPQHTHLDNKGNPLTIRVVASFKIHDKLQCLVSSSQAPQKGGKTWDFPFSSPREGEGQESCEQGEPTQGKLTCSSAVWNTVSDSVWAMRDELHGFNHLTKMSASQVHQKIWVSPVNLILILFIQHGNSSGIAQGLQLCEIRGMAYRFNIHSVLACLGTECSWILLPPNFLEIRIDNINHRKGTHSVWFVKVPFFYHRESFPTFRSLPILLSEWPRFSHFPSESFCPASGHCVLYYLDYQIHLGGVSGLFDSHSW